MWRDKLNCCCLCQQDFVEAFDGIDNGIAQYDTDSPPRYKNKTDLAYRVGGLNPSWNETGVDVQVGSHFFAFQG